MPLFNDLAALLRSSVGNNMENNPQDLRAAKQLLAAEGQYKRPIDENKYIDSELDEAITTYQRDYNLKIDGIMNPGGETEAMLVSKRLGLPAIKSKKPEEIQNVNEARPIQRRGIGSGMMLGGGASGTGIAIQNQHPEDPDKNVPLFGALAEGLGISGADAAAWWANQSADEREDIVRKLKSTLDSDQPGHPDYNDPCLKQYDRDMDKCARLGNILGYRAKIACKGTASSRLSQCLTSDKKQKNDKMNASSKKMLFISVCDEDTNPYLRFELEDYYWDRNRHTYSKTDFPSFHREIVWKDLEALNILGVHTLLRLSGRDYKGRKEFLVAYTNVDAKNHSILMDHEFHRSNPNRKFCGKIPIKIVDQDIAFGQDLSIKVGKFIMECLPLDKNLTTREYADDLSNVEGADYLPCNRARFQF